MPKKLYIYCTHHMDLIWQRGWSRTHFGEFETVRPYQDLEERQLFRWLELLRQGRGVRHSIEQTLTLRMFVERNPEQAPALKRMLHEGTLAVDGGGESIVDTNLISGESFLRNHLYSLRWLRETFDYRPAVAIETDTFGLSAQLPQVLTGFGYDAIATHSRVFEPADRIWRGLDGTGIYVVRFFAEESSTELIYKWHAFCAGGQCVCGHRGCDACGGFGAIFNGAGRTDPDKLHPLFEQIARSECDDVLLFLCSEREIPSPGFLDELERLAEGIGVEFEFATLNDLRQRLATPVYDRFQAGELRPGDVSAKAEGNPVCTGCYVSRIQLKQINRELENLLTAAETWAAFAAGPKWPYPAGKLAGLWNKLALFQFHDAVTGPHTDECYADLKSIGVEIRSGGLLVAGQACRQVAERITAEAREGYHAFALFNPLNWNVADQPVTAWVDWTWPEASEWVEVVDAGGAAVAVAAFEPHQKLGRAKLVLAGPALPPIGYSVFHYRPAAKPQQPATTVDAAAKTPGVIENEYFRIPLSTGGLGAIYDKQLGLEITRPGAGNLIVEEDYGSPWETLAKPYFSQNTSNWNRPPRVETSSETITAVFEGEVADARLSSERHLHSLKWSRRITLYHGLPGIYFSTTLTWESENLRLSFTLPLSFTTPNDAAYYEIPFGLIRREAYEPQYGIHTNANGDWPALNSVALVDETRDFTVTLCNRGLPAHRVKDGTVSVGLVRSPQIPVYIRNFRGARDPGPHVFETALFTTRGGVREAQPVHRGMAYNARFMAANIATGNSDLPARHSFLANRAGNVVFTAVKRAEDGGGLIVRGCEVAGETALDQMVGLHRDRQVLRVNLLEDNAHEPGELTYRPFELKTLLIQD